MRFAFFYRYREGIGKKTDVIYRRKTDNIALSSEPGWI